MQLKIIFSEPPFNMSQATEDEQLIFIQSPYRIIQAELGDTRKYEKSDGTMMPDDFTYEMYCEEMSALIRNIIHESTISDCIFDKLTLEGFNQPPNFKAICFEIGITPLHLASKSKILFVNCSFGGRQYVDSLGNMIRFQQRHHFERQQEPLVFEVTFAEEEKTCLSEHDKARLSMLKDVVLYQNKREISLKPFIDDSLIGVTNPFLLKFKSPSFFCRDTGNSLQRQSTAEILLKNFFSQNAQQQSDYTCGPAAVKMVAEYFDSMRLIRFCGASLNSKIWRQMAQMSEIQLAEHVSATEAVGSRIPDIRKFLMEAGITVFDDNGLFEKDHRDTLSTHKNLLWSKIQQILKLGIPVIVNMKDREGCGHYEVIIGIEKSAHEEHIILAEPGTALVGKLEFERIAKETFVSRWKDEDCHGRFMILSPNEASSHAIGAIFSNVSHYRNGEYIEGSPTKPRRHHTLFSSKTRNWNFVIHKLSDRLEHPDGVRYLEQAVQWADNVWGYLDFYQPVHKKDIQDHAHQFYIATYGGVMVGMFSLRPRDHFDPRFLFKTPHSPSTTLLELSYFYIEESVRNFGMGREMFHQATRIAKTEFEAKLIIFDTINPLLNRFYHSLGAKVVCDSVATDCLNKVDNTIFSLSL